MDELEEERLLKMLKKVSSKLDKNDTNKFEEILKQAIEETFCSRFKLAIESKDNDTHTLTLEGTKPEIKTALAFMINDLKERNILSKKEILIAVMAGLEAD